MIHGYADQTSVKPGSGLTLRVSTDAPRFGVEFFRQGARFASLGDLGLGSSTGHNAPFHPSDQDWGVDGRDAAGNVLPGWTAYEVAIPATWASGVYVAILTEEDEAGRPLSSPDTGTSDGRDSKALFVVTSPRPGTTASILYKINLFTFQAYNLTGAPLQSLYPPNPGAPGEADEQAVQVSLRRPGGGTGGIPHDTTAFPDAYDQNSPRESFEHWDGYFISWLEEQGYQVDYCTDLDIHSDDGSFLDKYRLLLSNGHDEYWSERMYANVFKFVGHGGNAAFFSANTCWWQIIVADDDLTIARGENYFRTAQPENRITGVSYRNGGGQWDGPRPADAGYTVLRADHWVFDGTGLSDGQVFGATYEDNRQEQAALCGYECDGAAFDRAQLAAGGAVTPVLTDGTPDTFVILAACDLAGWQDYPDGNRVATMGIHDRGGTVFTAATSDWSRVLGSRRAPEVDRITRNVIDRLSIAAP